MSSDTTFRRGRRLKGYELLGNPRTNQARLSTRTFKGLLGSSGGRPTAPWRTLREGLPMTEAGVRLNEGSGVRLVTDEVVVRSTEDAGVTLTEAEVEMGAVAGVVGSLTPGVRER